MNRTHAAAAGALTGGSALTIRALETVRGPRAGALEIDAGLDAGSLVCVTAQLLLVSARSDPLARQAVLTGLLDWAATHARETTPAAVAAASPVDSTLLRAIVVAWAAHPDLPVVALPAWLRDRLLLEVASPVLAAALAELRQRGVIDAESRP